MSIEKRPLTAEDLYALELITGLDQSPDGRWIVYSLQRVAQETEKKLSNLWLVSTEEGAPRQFTFGDHVDARPKFSPDGRSIAFISNRADEKQPQLYVIPLAGGEARSVTDLKGMIASFSWSPDGQTFALSFIKKDQAVLEREENPQKEKLGVVERHITRALFRFDGQGYLPEEKPHIWTIPAAGGEGTQLTDGEYGENDPRWTPDGKHLLFNSTRYPDWDIRLAGNGLYRIPAAGGEMEEIPTHGGSVSLVAVSPDGRSVAYLGNREVPGNWWQNLCLFVAPLDTDGGAVRNLSLESDVDLGSSTLGDFGSPPDTTRPIWSADGRSIFVTATRHGASPLLCFDVAGGGMSEVLNDGYVIGNPCLAADGSHVAYFSATYFDPCQIRLTQLESGETRVLTAVNQALLDEIVFGEIEEVWFKGPDDNDLQGWILTPPDFDPSHTYPSILEIHGGPQTQYGRTFMHEFYYLASQGYVIYWTNPRGGQGYGEGHAGAINGQWGTVDYADLMAWTDLVGERPFIDTERMGVTGGSYGGYMTGMIIGMTDRFKAAAPQRMVSNLVSFHGSSDFNWGVKYLVGIEGEPWNNLEDYWKMSPLSLVGNVTTPTLVIHSEQDLRCAAEQGEQYFVALRLRGIDTELVLLPGESHGLSRGGRTDRRIARLNHILRWMDKYLKG